MKWWPSDIKEGDIIRIKIGSIYHYGIYISDSEVVQFGLPPVNGFIAVNQKDIKVCTSTILEFASGQVVETAILDKSEKRKAFSVEDIIKNARSHIGEGNYNILTNNCEHLVYDCVFGVKKSQQEELFRKSLKNKAVVDVYVSRIPEDLDFDSSAGKDLLDEIYPQEKKDEILKISDNKLKKQKYWAWDILKRALCNSFYFNISDLTFKKDKFGKWTSGQVYFSISHSGDYVCVAVSNNKIGVDLEIKSAFENKFADPEEKKTFVNSILCSREANFDYTISDLLLMWQKKESIFKCYGKKTFDPSKIDSTKYGCSVYTPKANTDLSVVICGEKVEYIKYYLDEASGFIRQL